MPLTRVKGNIIADGTITNADISASAAISPTKLGAGAFPAGTTLNPSQLDAGALPSDITTLATGSNTARSLANRFADVVNVKDYGALGNGVADDSSEIQAAIDACPAGGAVYFPKGSYLAFRIKVTKNLSIVGDGIGATEWVWSQNTWSYIANELDAYFQVNGGTTNFYLEGGTIIDKFGFRVTGNANITAGVASLYAGDAAPYRPTFPNKIQIKNVRFVDLYDCISGHAANLNVENCEFIYTYGMAGISSPMPDNSAPSGHPCAAIGGGFGSLIVKNNYFNGLVDESFSGANPLSVNCRTAAHNFIIGGLRHWSISQWGGANKQFVHDYSNNTIINYGIEGIQFAQQQDFAGTPVARMPKNVGLNITGNFLKSVQNFWLPNYYPANTPAIICLGRLPSTTISGNTIHFARYGVVVDQWAFNPSFTPVPANPSLYGNISITNNTLLGVNVGIIAKYLSPKDIVSGNSIFCQAKPLKDATAQIRAINNNLPISYNGLFGIRIEANTTASPSGPGSENGCPVISNNELSAEYDWDLTTTITAINTGTRQITLASVAGITLLPAPATQTFGFWVLHNGRAWAYSIESIVGNVVTVPQGGVLLPNFPLGTSVYWSKFISSTDAAINGFNIGVELFAYNNTIKGFFKDATTEFSSNQKFYLVNTVTKDVYEKTADYPSFYSANAEPVADGYYTKI